jgi:hypothetical protein
MAYAIHLRGAEKAPIDGQPVGFRVVRDASELHPYEKYVETLPDGVSNLVWSKAKGRPVDPPEGMSLAAFDDDD